MGTTHWCHSDAFEAEGLKPDPGRLQPLEPGWIGRDRTALIRFAAPQTRGMDANEQQPGSRDQQTPATSDLEDRGESDRQEREDTAQPDRPTSDRAIDPRSLPVSQRISLLVRALNGAKRTNEALASCRDGALKRRWYEAQQRLRNQIDRTYEARMDFSLQELEAGRGGVASAPDTDTSAFLAAQQRRN